MRTIINFIGIVVFFTASVFSQTATYKALSSAEKTATIQKIKKNSEQLKTLKLDFAQEKKSKLLTNPAVSKGNMLYKKGGLLRWNYTSPKNFSIILNKKGSFFKNEKGAISNQIIGDMGKMIMNTVNGEELTKQTNFSVALYVGKDGTLLAKLTPKDKKISELYSSMEVYLNPTTLIAKKVVLKEKKGDVTTITFSNQQKNVTIADTEFDE